SRARGRLSRGGLSIVRGVGSGDSAEVNVVYTADEGLSGRLIVEVGGEKVLDRAVSSPGGRLSLGRLEAGQHDVRAIFPEGFRAFLSHSYSVQDTNYLRRTGIRLDGRKLSFRYVKKEPGEEVLVGRLYLASASEERIGVCVSIRSSGMQALGPYDSWTFRERHFDVRPGELGDVVAVDESWENLRNSRRLAIPLRNDLEPGEYVVEWTFDEEVTGLLTLSRVSAGLYDRVRFVRE
ncbi:MAG: hypothetical protein AAF517_12560, partial [Planctomycetota bacterium]